MPSPKVSYVFKALLSLAVLAAGTVSPYASEAETEGAPRVFGWLEKAIVMPVGATVKMKLDSGALTSSMDAKNIEIFRRNGRRWVRFRLHLQDKITGEEVYRDLELPVKRFVRLRGAGGEDRRPVVKLPLCIGNKIYTEEFTLRDRDDMLYPVLIGRRTLKHLGFLDVTSTYLVPPTCDVPADVSQAVEVHSRQHQPVDDSPLRDAARTE